MNKLPFEDFVAALRQKGVVVGLAEQERLARVLAAYDGHKRDELRVVVGALLGGDRQGRERVREVFDQLLPRSEEPIPVEALLGGPAGQGQGQDGEGRAAKGKKGREWLRWVGVVLGVVLVAGCAYGIWRWSQPGVGVAPDLMPPADFRQEEPDQGPAPRQEEPPPDIRDYLPPPPRVLDLSWRRPAALGLALLFWAGWLARRLLAERRRAMAATQGRLLSGRPGPQRYRLKLPSPRPLLRGDDLDDFAVLLGRLDEARGGDLDVEQVAEEQAARGFLARIHHLRVRRRRAIVVLRDLSPESQVFAGKTEALLTGLSRRGIPLQVYTFEGDGGHLLPADGEDDGPGLTLAEVGRRHDGAPLLVLGVGVGLRRGFEPVGWLWEVRRLFPRRAWLTPIEDPARWAEAMQEEDFPVPVWPMTRAGFRGAAAALLPPERRRHVPRSSLIARPVREADIEQAARAIAMVPYAELGLAEQMVHKHCPGVSSDVLWELYRKGTDATGAVLRWGRRELGRLLERHRADEGAGRARVSEGALRCWLAAIYRASAVELPQGSVGRARAELEGAVQLLYLEDRRAEALGEIRRLAQVLGRAEVERAVGRLSYLPVPDEAGREALAGQVEGAIAAGEGAAQGEGEAARPAPGWVFRGLRAWPRAFWVQGGLLGAVLVGAVWLGGGWLARALGTGVVREQVKVVELKQDGAGALRAKPLEGVRVEEIPAQMGLYCDVYGDGRKAAVRTMEMEKGSGRLEGLESQAKRWCLLRAVRPGGDGEEVHSNLQQVKEKETPPPPLPPPPPEPEKPGRVRLHLATPGLAIGDVKVDGKPAGAEVMEHAPGRAVVTVETPYYSFKASPEVKAGAEVTVLIQLEKTHGLVVLEGLPERSTVRGREAAKLWGARGMTVRGPAGTHQVSWRAPGVAEQVVAVRIEAGQTLRQQVVVPDGPPAPVPVPGKMVKIPGGTFRMGSEKYDDEKPIREVTVPPFFMDVTEVTIAAYRACVNAGPCTPPGTGGSCNWGKTDREDHPVNCVDWEQARIYCKYIGGQLPTEEQWEFAARGPQSLEYPWGAGEPSNQLCWYKTSPNGTCQVTRFPPHLFGLRDMSGNVWEWTADRYCESRGYKNKCSDTSLRALRGGSWNSNGPDNFRGANRGNSDSRERNNNVGFRCAKLSQ